MNFYEAQKEIDSHFKELDKYTLHSNPPHRVLGCIVAPKNRDHKTEEYIFVKCIEGGESNEKLIFDLNLFIQELIPLVAIQIWGNVIFIPLDSYISVPSTGNASK